MFRLLLPWFAMLSITVAFKYGEHIAILAMRRSLSGWPLAAARVVCFAAIAAFAGLLVWYGTAFFLGATNVYILSDTIQVSHRWTAACVPVAGILLLLHLADGLALLEERGVLALDEPVVPSEAERSAGVVPSGGDGADARASAATAPAEICSMTRARG